jgi:hypothetical protein
MLTKQVESMSGGGGRPKPPTPKRFTGKPEDLPTFLTAMKLYLAYYAKDYPFESDKVLAAAMHLEGDALRWMQSFVDDRLKYPDEKDQDKETREIFSDYEDGFVKQIKGVFGEVDEERTAQRKLARMKQTGSASAYASSFRQVTGILNWEDEPLISAFYSGLKERVKDEISRDDWPDSLGQMIEKAVKIDNRQHEREQEKKGMQNRPTSHAPKQTRGTHGNQQKNNSPWVQGDPMDLSHIRETKGKFRNPESRHQQNMKTSRGISQEERRRRFENKACLRCGEVGHFRRECQKKASPTVARIAMIQEDQRQNEAETGTRILTKEKINSRVKKEKCWICGRKSHIGCYCHKMPDKIRIHPDDTTSGEPVRQALRQQHSIEDRIVEEVLYQDMVKSELATEKLCDVMEVPWNAAIINYRTDQGTCWICGSEWHAGPECMISYWLVNVKATPENLKALQKAARQHDWEQEDEAIRFAMNVMTRSHTLDPDRNMDLQVYVSAEDVHKRLQENQCWICQRRDHKARDCAYNKNPIRVAGDNAAEIVKKAVGLQGPEDKPSVLPETKPDEEWTEEHQALPFRECKFRECETHHNEFTRRHGTMRTWPPKECKEEINHDSESEEESGFRRKKTKTEEQSSVSENIDLTQVTDEPGWILDEPEMPKNQ